ncbi:DUF1579 domain-containing protein [bacterium]|nr:DUF1579 domain-containing protein [bacterium]
MRSTLVLVAMVLLVAVTAFAKEEAMAPTPSPDALRTVAAFSGTWVYDSTFTEQGKEPAKFPLTVNCKKVVDGQGSYCEGNATMPTGPWSGSFLISWDPFTKKIHFYSLTSDGERHLHVCQWKSKTDLACDTLKAGLGETPVSEDLTFMFNEDASTFASTYTFEDGSKATFVGKGARTKK